MIKKNKTLIGTIRIKVKDCKAYEKTFNSWKKYKIGCSDALQVIKLFKAHKNLDVLIDKKDSRFFKGQLSKEGNPQGARINLLPNGRKLNLAYSLFGKHLTIHDELSNEHWDVIYQNPCGTYSYLYTMDKKQSATKIKYNKVEQFEKCYPILKRGLLRDLKTKDDALTLAMYTLLKTLMRIGNEIYYNAHRHKGLTTIKKKNILIKGKNVTFNYIGKGGVPLVITEEFPKVYLIKLKRLLNTKKKEDFVFTNTGTNHPLKEISFKKAFKDYTGKEFYPHIVRSHFATKQAKQFLKQKNFNKQDVKEFYLSIAEKLGHKRFVKKDNQWEASFNVTVSHYIDPLIVEKINSMVK